jgi:T5SS/PEP-CTERM-associated repeat protein
VGYFGAGNSLIITDGGYVDNSVGVVGLNSSSSNNTVLVSGSGSVWSNGSHLSVGNIGSGNSLVISNSGQVVDGFGYLGYNSTSSSNTALVTDGGIWQNGSLYAGYLGSGNSLVVDGGSVLATNLTMGVDSATCNNLVQLDSGSDYRHRRGAQCRLGVAPRPVGSQRRRGTGGHALDHEYLRAIRS